MIKKEYRWLTDIYVAHRGLFNNVDVPENSVPAFIKASESGFGIETDVQMTKDGVLVVFHDDTLDRMTNGHGKLCDHTFSELRELKLGATNLQIPTFAEFLQAANGANLIVEIKTHENIGETEQKIYDQLKGYKGNFCIESFNPFIVRWFKVNAPEVIRGQLSFSYKGMPMAWFKRSLLSKLRFCKWNGSQFIAYDANTINCKYVRKWAKKVPIICWTITSQPQLDKLQPYFDNIIFDSFTPERRDLQKLEGEHNG